MATKITERRQFVVTGQVGRVVAVLKGDGLEQRVDEWGEFSYLDEDGKPATMRLRIEDVLRLGVIVRELMRRAGDGRDFCNEHGLHVETSASKWRCPECVAAEEAEKAAKEAPEGMRAAGSALGVRLVGGVPMVTLAPAERDGDAA